MEKKMETTIIGYIVGYILGLWWDNGKENEATIRGYIRITRFRVWG